MSCKKIPPVLSYWPQHVFFFFLIVTNTKQLSRACCSCLFLGSVQVPDSCSRSRRSENRQLALCPVPISCRWSTPHVKEDGLSEILRLKHVARRSGQSKHSINGSEHRGALALSDSGVRPPGACPAHHSPAGCLWSLITFSRPSVLICTMGTMTA